MDFSHYTDQPVDLAVALINTLQIEDDLISDSAQLEEFLDEFKGMWKGAAQPPKKEELEPIRRLRESLRAVIASDDEVSASEQVNKILESYHAVPRVSLHSGTPHFHFETTGASMCSWLGATTAMGLASVIVEHGIDRFGVCCSGDCDDVYVDTSRNRSRRHCSNTCSTREAVAAYRKRQAE